MQPPTAPAELDRRTLYEEILIVLSLSLLASAAYAIISLLSAPLKGGYVASANQTNVLARQLVAIAFSLAPVWLVVHLLRRSGEGVGAIGLAWDQPARDIKRGVAFFAVVGLGGLAFYFGAVALGVNRFVVPVPPLGHWWTVPILVLNAAQAALLEEVIVLGYLITRLRQLAWSPFAAVAASALLRGSYHLYQGWGGFAGNLAMGVLFGVAFLRLRRTWPFVIAHFLLDVAAGDRLHPVPQAPARLLLRRMCSELVDSVVGISHQDRYPGQRAGVSRIRGPLALLAGRCLLKISGDRPIPRPVPALVAVFRHTEVDPHPVRVAVALDVDRDARAARRLRPAHLERRRPVRRGDPRDPRDGRSPRLRTVPRTTPCRPSPGSRRSWRRPRGSPRSGRRARSSSRTRRCRGWARSSHAAAERTRARPRRATARRAPGASASWRIGRSSA